MNSRKFAALFLTASVLFSTGLAQAAPSYTHGQHVEPAYEGWWVNDDGTISFVFGYFNENWEETPDIPVGANNFFSPGEQDRGQPTHFLPRRNRFTFEVVVPADWGDRELVWTINSPNGETRKAYASTRVDYVIDNIIIASETGSLGAGTSSPESRANVAPQIEILGDSVRTARVGEPLVARARVTDDGIPAPGRVGSSSRFVEAQSEEEFRDNILRRPRRNTVGKVNGLYFSWNKYRGPGDVIFDPPQVKVWEDTRTSAYSPWGALYTPVAVPGDGIYETTVTFTEPGTYTLWGRADDGGLYKDQFIEVTVEP